MKDIATSWSFRWPSALPHKVNAEVGGLAP